LKNLPEHNEDYELLQQALSLTEQAAKDLNKEKSQKERRDKVAEIAARMKKSVNPFCNSLILSENINYISNEGITSRGAVRSRG
jgi:hypothetical protein